MCVYSKTVFFSGADSNTLNATGDFCSLRAYANKFVKRERQQSRTNAICNTNKNARYFRWANSIHTFVYRRNVLVGGEESEEEEYELKSHVVLHWRKCECDETKMRISKQLFGNCIRTTTKTRTTTRTTTTKTSTISKCRVQLQKQQQS